MPSTRTIITLPQEDKKWLEDYSHKHRRSLAEVIRQAIAFFRVSARKNNRKEILTETAGLWKNKKRDTLAIVDELRNEWDR